MSELIQKNDNRATIRWKLLTGASALALTAYISSAGLAKSEDTDRPLIWLELGGQAEMVSGQGAVFNPGFIAANPNSPVLQKVSPLQAQQPSKFSFGEEVKLSYQPEDSDWVIGASVRIGRSSNYRRVDHQTHGTFYKWQKYGKPLHLPQYPSFNTHPLSWERFAKTNAGRDEKHVIIDFTAGKDVGLGLFGGGSSSVLSAGVRFAQFTANQSVDMRARPDLVFGGYTFAAYHLTYQTASFKTYHVTGHAARSFHGVGPTLAWTGSAPFAGNAQDGEIAFDWSANAAILFGKQRARVRHVETGWSKERAGNDNFPYVTLYQHSGGHDNVRSVTVPNIGASAGLSFRYAEAKVSFGYRADLFMNVMDTGIDARNSSNVLFHGPYASISIGLGD